VPDAAGVPSGAITQRWAAPSGARIALRSWDDEWVAYVEATGTTHLLSDAAGIVAALLQDAGRPLDITELSTALGPLMTTHEPSGQGENCGHEFSLGGVLGELERIGLATMHGS